MDVHSFLPPGSLSPFPTCLPCLPVCLSACLPCLPACHSQQVAWTVTLPWRVLSWGLSFALDLGRMVFDLVTVVDAYIFNLVTGIVSHYRKKVIGIVMEFSLLPLNLVLSAIEMACFGLFVAIPAYRVGRKLYKKEGSLIAKNIHYGETPSQVLDVYLLEGGAAPRGEGVAPSPSPPPTAPVVIFVQGGGWTICQKAVYAMMGKALRSRGVVTVIPEYTAFPQGDVAVMLNDVKSAIAWTMANIDKFGGNQNKVYLVGNSAGAHLSSLTLLTELENHLRGNAPHTGPQDMNKSKSAPSLPSFHNTHWTYSGIRAFIGISGPYNVPQLFKNMIVEGKEFFSGLSDIMRGKENFERYSPQHNLQRTLSNYSTVDVSVALPPMTLIHGSRFASFFFWLMVSRPLIVPPPLRSDKTCQLSQAMEFDRTLRQAGVHGKLIVYENQSHLESISLFPSLCPPLSKVDFFFFSFLHHLVLCSSGSVGGLRKCSAHQRHHEGDSERRIDRVRRNKPLVDMEV